MEGEEKLLKKWSFFLEKRIFLHVQTYNLYVRKNLEVKIANRSRITEKVGKLNLYR